VITTDVNHNQVDYSPVTIDDSQQMWLMYTPSKAASISIPLASSPWHWGGKLTWNATTQSWSLANASPAAAGNAPAAATDTYPVWSQILTVPFPPK